MFYAIIETVVLLLEALCRSIKMEEIYPGLAYVALKKFLLNCQPQSLWWFMFRA